MRILVTGGAGYIGTHACRHLLQHHGQGDHEIHALDNLCRGHAIAVPNGVTFHEIDIRDTASCLKLVNQIGQVDCIMHFAGLAYVSESVHDPVDYYDNNTTGTLSLIKVVEKAKIQRMIFSSSCTTYGEAESLPLTESHPQSPIIPYGMSKYMSERMLQDYAASKASQDAAFAYGILRYFNVCGAAMDGTLGEDHRPETHLIPNLLFAAMGKLEKFMIFGDDYPTPDGTCIRDFIHVEDLVAAHRLVMDAMDPALSTQEGKPCDAHIYNLGSGKGYSVKEVIKTAERIIGQKIPIEIKPRRVGDAPSLYASSEKIKKNLGWEPKHKTLDSAIKSAWDWFQKNPRGYE